ncbi:hypothetical protein MXB_5211 [Myxobolus squamalis]|nr:hypothetical protein MXB_5211 [Myxobolus squamalis]
MKSGSSNETKSRTDVGIMANVLSEQSTTGLIMNERPNLMDPKCEKELKNHIKLNEKYFSEIKKNNEKNIQKQLSYYNNKIKKEENVSNLIFKWKNKVIPNWNTMYKCYNNETKSMWWEGLPSCIRSIVWKLATENNLQLTKSFIKILLNESEQNIDLYHNGKLIDHEDKSKLNGCVSTYKTKQIIRMIELDVNRTYPHLNIFQTNAPLHLPLKLVLSAYCCFRKDIGYVQGMSFIVALLLLNIDTVDTFIVFANMMNNPLRIALFTLREDLLHHPLNANLTLHFQLKYSHRAFAVFYCEQLKVEFGEQQKYLPPVAQRA